MACPWCQPTAALQVHIPNRCQPGGARLSTGEAELSEGPKGRNVEQLKKDPNSCFFEGQHHAHGTRWAPDYDKKCSICSCQVWGYRGELSVAPLMMDPSMSHVPAVPRSARSSAIPSCASPSTVPARCTLRSCAAPSVKVWGHKELLGGCGAERGGCGQYLYGYKVGVPLWYPEHALPDPCREEAGAGGAEAGTGTGQQRG